MDNNETQGDFSVPKNFVEKLKRQTPRPSEFMRGRRPELFSDTTVFSAPLLTPEMFEYHLQTLTSRKQETVFEHFCRRLAEKELCPNLLPQTGPTGGGDSKTDSETYPVAEEIAIRWYEGSQAAASEKWAFAFSAKRDWRAKLRSDIDKIVGTGRKYSLIYFITNQYVKDKTRASLEAELTSEHGTPIHILDRTWIIDRVFKNDRLELAADTLGLDTRLVSSTKQVGPLDTRRKQELEQLEREIQDTSRYAGIEYQLVEDSLRTALLARSLELPRTEVEGRFERAERVAESAGFDHQTLRVQYDRAWTAYWWYEDFEEFYKRFKAVESSALQSDNAAHLELLTNLWNVLQNSGARHPDIVASLPSHREKLIAKLKALAQDATRPNNALWARTNLALAQATNAITAGPDQLRSFLAEMESIVTESDGLVDYPFEPTQRIIVELGQWFPDSEEYDRLFERVVRTTKKRLSAQESGRLLLARGLQKLRGRNIYEAIRFFGRAQQTLAMHEARDELVEALFACSSAYDAAGLFWAARANLLAATNQALADFRENGHLSFRALLCMQRMVWIELEIGRVAPALQWLMLADATAATMGLSGERQQRVLQQRENQDALLSLLFLRTRNEDLQQLRFLPDVLAQLDLPISYFALLYALGHEDFLRQEGFIPKEESAQSVLELFEQWVDKQDLQDLPDGLSGIHGSKVVLRSNVLGYDIRVETSDDDDSLFLGERLLASLEALLATSFGLELFPNTEQFTIVVEQTGKPIERPEFESIKSGQ